ncbi:MAG: hypothetical protein ACRD2U_10830 [Terriglobales bacterium]
MAKEAITASFGNTLTSELSDDALAAVAFFIWHVADAATMAIPKITTTDLDLDRIVLTSLVKWKPPARAGAYFRAAGRRGHT